MSDLYASTCTTPMHGFTITLSFGQFGNMYLFCCYYNKEQSEFAIVAFCLITSPRQCKFSFRNYNLRRHNLGNRSTISSFTLILWCNNEVINRHARIAKVLYLSIIFCKAKIVPVDPNWTFAERV